MHECWTILAANMMYTRSQNYTNMVVDKKWNTNIQSCGYCIVTNVNVFVLIQTHILLFNVFVLIQTHILLLLDKWFVQICLNINNIVEQVLILFFWLFMCCYY